MTYYFINPHQNHSLGKTISNVITFRKTISKMSFVFDAIMASGRMGVLQTEFRFPEMSRFFPNIKIINKVDLKLWSINKVINKTILYFELANSNHA